MAVVAGIDKDRHGVTGTGLTLHRIANIIFRARQVTIDAQDASVGVAMEGMSGILSLILVASGASCRFCSSNECSNISIFIVHLL